jgi:acyl-CoA thioesterase I
MILCYGDSLTAGYGVSDQASYPTRLQQRLRTEGFTHRVVNAGVSGDTTAGALDRLGRFMSTKPRIAIVTLGANDGLGGQNLGVMQNNLEDIIQRLDRANVQVILGGMELPMGYDLDYISAFAQVYPRLAQEHNIPLIPSFLAGVAGIPEHNLMDGFHPNETGYAIILENVWRVLYPLL